MLDCITKDTSFRKLVRNCGAFICKVYQQVTNVTTSGIHFEIGDILFVLMLYIPVNNFSIMLGCLPGF